AHIGFTPQKLAVMGGYSIQAEVAESSMEVLADAKALEEAGASSIALVAVPSEVAKAVTESVKVPVYCMAAGPYCDGQALLVTDMLGATQLFIPKYIKKYANLRDEMAKAFGQYVDEVRNGRFPAEGYYETMRGEEEKRFRDLLSTRSV
ncbi:MAG: 3-methyl-2-oxobutanoate hydroxymethyltransferase, partial [Chloroflexota bacterium]